MGRVITSPGVLKNVQGQIDHVTDLYEDIKDNNLKPMTLTIDPVTNANGEYTHTTTDERVTEDMKPLDIEVGTPECFYAPVTITTADGSITLYCPDAHGTSTVTVTLIHTMPIDGGEDVPSSVTSTEFDILADRIGALTNLNTADKSDIVHAVNEVNNNIGVVPSGKTVETQITELNANINSIRKLKYVDLTDTTPMNVNSKSGGTITVDNFVGCASRTSGVMPLAYYNNTVQYIKLVNHSDLSAYSGSATVRVWYV